jgi:hypothetical protein
MKLKCNDGLVREFVVAHVGFDGPHEYVEAYCRECGEGFGIHDTHILKPKFKEHSCEGST